MKLKRIQVKNFRSFQLLDVVLKDFNVVIGANASGKSNFIELLHFLRHAQEFGLDNAIGMQGGVEYFRNVIIGSEEEFRLKVDVSLARSLPFPLIGDKRRRFVARVNGLSYNLGLRFYARRLGYSIASELITGQITVSEPLLTGSRQKKVEGPVQDIAFGEFVLGRRDRRIFHDIKLNKEIGLVKNQLFPPFLGPTLDRTELILSTPYINLVAGAMFREIAIYDFDPKLSKKAVRITGKVDLDEDGRNLPIVLKRVLADRDKARRLTTLLRDLLPFVSKVSVNEVVDKSVLLNVREVFANKKILPATLISDGTINAIALVVGLFFELEDVAIFEEPERNLHPALISKIVAMMRERAAEKQIFVTTHNADFIRTAGTDGMFFMSRDEKGFSNMAPPTEKAEVKAFLKNHIGIDELFSQNLLAQLM